MPKTTDLIILTRDVDCDGTSYGAHRVTVPASMGDVRDASVLVRFAREQDQRVTADYFDAVITPAQFRASYKGLHETLWGDIRYATVGADWNPWVRDDTLGTIYDHTYDM